MILYLCLPIHTHTIWGNLGLSILPDDISTCRLEEPGIKPPTLADNLFYLLSNSCPQLYITAYPSHGCDWLELILAVIGQEAACTLDRLPFHYRADTQLKQSFMFTFTPTGNLGLLINVHVFGQWGEARYLRTS